MKTASALSSAAALAFGLALTASPAGAAVVHVASPVGGYSVFYDPAQQSTPITQVQTGYEGMFFHVDQNYQGMADPNGTADGLITGTAFTLHLNLTFVADPGTVFTSLEIDDGVVGYHHGFYGGEDFDQATTITPLHGGSSTAFVGPHLQNFPPFGQGGGGAYNAGIFFGRLTPPPAGGFVVDSTQSVTLYDTSTWSLGSVDFYIQTAAAPPPGVPEPATWALTILGFGAVGATLRRRGFAPA